jgi:hypothetical protein
MPTYPQVNLTPIEQGGDNLGQAFTKINAGFSALGSDVTGLESGVAAAAADIAVVQAEMGAIEGQIGTRDQDITSLIRAAATTGLPGWAMAVATIGPGKPQTMTYSKETERVRLTLTWSGADLVTQIVYAYSSNSGGSYTTYATQTISYDGSGYMTGTNWT